MTLSVRRAAFAVAPIAAALTACAAGPVSAQQPSSEVRGANRLANPSAETGDVGGWTGAGFAVARYGSASWVPSLEFAERNSLGNWLFYGAQTGATLSQQVDFADLADKIEAGQQPIGVLAMLGAAGPGPDGMELTLQPQDAAGVPLGSPTLLGPPTAVDRNEAATMLECRARIIAPVGMRSALVTLRATGTPGAMGTAIADKLLVADELITSGVANWTVPAEGPNCYRPPPLPPPPVSSPPGGTPSTLSPPPGSRPTPAAAIASRIRLTATRLTLYVSAPSILRIDIARSTTVRRHASEAERKRWRTVQRLTLRVRSMGLLRRPIRKLPRGRYRVIVRAVGPDGIATSRARVTVYPSPIR